MNQLYTHSYKQLPWLDLLRFMSAFMILIAHYRASAFVEYGLLPGEDRNQLTALFFFMSRAGGAVLIFFVLSGFFIMGRGIEKCRKKTFSLRKYAIDRFARIMLPLSSALLLLVIINYICGVDFSWVNIVLNLFSMQGILCGPAVGPLWSLSYEVWFYILFGAMTWLITYSSLSSLRCMSIGGVIICITATYVSFLAFTKLSPHYLFIWIMGGLAYIIPMRKSKLILILSLVCLSASVVLMEFTKGSRSISATVNIGMSVIEIIFALFCCVVIRQICHFHPKGKIATKINNTGTHLAKFSYTLYLTHMVILKLMVHLGMPKSTKISFYSCSLFVGEVMIALVSAYLIYFLFERNTKKFKEFLLAITSKK